MKSRKQEIVNLAIEYIETRGVHAFSYNDISKNLNITKASIHYHFPAKNDLIIAVVHTYQKQLERVIELALPIQNTKDRIIEFFQQHLQTLQADHICAIYSLEMSIATLDKEVQEAVQKFFHFEKEAVMNLLNVDEKSEFEAMRLLSLFKGALVHRRIDKTIDVIQMLAATV